MFLNIQSVRTKVDDLVLYLEESNSPYLVLICEHWLKIDEPLYVPNYVIADQFCRTNHRGGGTLIMILDSFNQQDDFTKIDKYNELLEEKCFEFSLVYSCRLSLYLLCFYRAPSGSVSVFLKKIETFLSYFKLGCKIMIGGDFNLGFHGNNPNTSIFKNLLAFYDIKMIVEEPTRITLTTSTLLDYVCCSSLLEYTE